MRLISWNILHGGGTRCNEIVQAIDEQAADIVVLQEFRQGKTKALICNALAACKYGHIRFAQANTARDNTLLVASRHPVAIAPFPTDSTIPARALSCQIQISECYLLNLMNVHFPQKRAQIPLFNALLDELPSHWLQDYSLLVGDFNCGIPFEDSQSKTFYATHLFQQLLANGWRDSWRSRHRKQREFSWVSTRKSNGFRYDHALASDKFDATITNVHYVHHVREQKLSDHSMLVIDFNGI